MGVIVVAFRHAETDAEHSPRGKCRQISVTSPPVVVHGMAHPDAAIDRHDFRFECDALGLKFGIADDGVLATASQRIFDRELLTLSYATLKFFRALVSP